MTPLIALLENVAWQKRPCKFCGKPLYFVRTKNGTTAPYTAEGINHFQDCPHFQKQPDARQEGLFPPDGDLEAAEDMAW